jgi:hypothetical protein
MEGWGDFEGKGALDYFIMLLRGPCTQPESHNLLSHLKIFFLFQSLYKSSLQCLENKKAISL